MSTSPTLTQRLRPNWLRTRFGPHGRAITRLHATLDGALSIREAAFLHTVARGRRTIVEIGSYRGKSTVIMALAEPNARITAIDPHTHEHTPKPEADNHAIFHRTLLAHGVADRIEHWRRGSRGAAADWDGPPIDLVFVDGDHTYEGAKGDLAEWSPLVAPGGVVAAHDTFRRRYEGCLRAWEQTIAQDRSFGPTRRVRTIAWARKHAAS
ncbi:MAG: class I SAM-dependent methyltransferase [Planctomycetota bacterium]